jgi:DNA polymerase I-like protein with 3'-5' exonuclease and polymerase domains
LSVADIIELLEIPRERVSAVERERAKRIVYAVIYGIGRDKLGG